MSKIKHPNSMIGLDIALGAGVGVAVGVAFGMSMRQMIIRKQLKSTPE
jgi:uncharacterized protein YneF (UPF0154 family)